MSFYFTPSDRVPISTQIGLKPKKRKPTLNPDPHGRDDFVEVNGVNIPRPGATSAEPSVPAPDGMAPPQAAPDPGPSRASMLSGATVRPPDSGPSRAAMLGVQADPQASRVGIHAQQSSPKNPGSLTVFPGTGAPRHYGPS